MLGKEIKRLKPGKDWEENLNYSSVSKDEKKVLCCSAFTRNLLSFFSRREILQALQVASTAVQNMLHATVHLPNAVQPLRAASAPIIFG